MEFTLRAAHKLVDKIDAHVRTISLDAIVVINAFDIANDSVAIEALYAEHSAELDRNLLRVDDLITIRTIVREQIRIENDVSGIGAVISQRKDNLDRVAMYARILASSRHDHIVSSATALQRQIARIQEADETRGDTVHFSLVNAEAHTRMEQYVAQVRRRIEELEDRLLHLNINTKIVLKDDHVATLQEENLI